jgi:tetratricopeptide (TPR) repeat protein
MMFAIAAALLSAAPPQAVSCGAANDEPGITCRALAHQTQGRFADAASAFERLAALLPASDPKRDRALAAAGNMWIAAAEPGKAAVALDRALAGAGLQADQRGEALLDRARAAEAQNDLKTARARTSEAAQTISDNEFLWYFSAALAIREGNAVEAKSAINRALVLAPSDPLILFEAGHVAHFSGDIAGARDYWTRAAAADPSGEVGKAAKEALALLDAPAAVQNGAQPTRQR